MKGHRVQVVLSQPVARTLFEAACKQQLSFSAYLRMILSQHALAAQPPVPTQDASQHGEQP